MSNIYERWHKYTQEVLAWAVDAPSTAISFALNSDHPKIIKRLMEHGERREWFILLGCDALCMKLAQAIAKNGSTQILILESDLNIARAFIENFAPLPNNVHILADTSPWALYLLSHPLLLGVPNPDNAIIHWTKHKTQRSQTLTTWRKLFLGAKTLPITANKDAQLKLSVGAIMHPDEKHLESFFAQIPAWVHELVIVWDGYIPQKKWTCATKIKHYARTLERDFSAQRNAMLEHCDGSWLFYLDADERLTKQSWDQLANLITLQNIGVYFPRLTFENDEEHVRMGHGLWPDVQLRLFPLQQGVHFVGSVHEKVAGLTANLCLAPHIPILHYSHVHKSGEELRQRLAIFSAAGCVEHKLSQAYPSLALEFFENFTTQNANTHIFQLPS